MTSFGNCAIHGFAMLRRRYRRNRYYAVFSDIQGMWRLVTQCALYTFRANMLSTRNRRPHVSLSTRCVGCAVCARLRRTLDTCMHIFNMFKTRVGTVTSWLRREIPISIIYYKRHSTFLIDRFLCNSFYVS